MGARIEMTSDNLRRGRKLTDDDDVSKGIARDIGRSVGMAAAQVVRGNNRRSTVQGGGLAFVARTAQKHPFGAAFGGTLIALRTIRGKPDVTL